jgi:general stress protein YciG
MAERNDRDVTPAASDDRPREARDGGRRGDGQSARPKSNRGFASMDPARQREIASKGGRAAHEKGTAHEWTPEEARQAGRKGGEIVSRDRAHMAAIGREGGGARSSRSGRNTPQGVAAQSGAGEDQEENDSGTSDTGRGAAASQ